METGRWTTIGIVAAVLLLFVVEMFGQVPAGYRGVVLVFGAPTGEVKQPGLYAVVPFVQKVALVNVQIQAYQAQAVEAASADLQDVHTGVTVNWQIDPADVVWIYTNLRNDVVDRILQPNVQESIKSAEAKFTAEQLITQRPQVKALADETLTSRVAPYHVRIAATSFTNFQFSETFTTAIEAKVTAEQNALKEKNNLAAVQFQAQQKVAAARGEAQALALRRAQLNPLILIDEYLARWDGHLPAYMGSTGGPILMPQIPTTGSEPNP